MTTKGKLAWLVKKIACEPELTTFCKAMRFDSSTPKPGILLLYKIIYWLSTLMAYVSLWHLRFIYTLRTFNGNWALNSKIRTTLPGKIPGNPREGEVQIRRPGGKRANFPPRNNNADVVPTGGGFFLGGEANKFSGGENNFLLQGKHPTGNKRGVPGGKKPAPGGGVQ